MEVPDPLGSTGNGLNRKREVLGQLPAGPLFVGWLRVEQIGDYLEEPEQGDPPRGNGQWTPAMHRTAQVSPHGLRRAVPQSIRARHPPCVPSTAGLPTRARGPDGQLRGGEFRTADVSSGSVAGAARLALVDRCQSTADTRPVPFRCRQSQGGTGSVSAHKPRR